MAASIPVDKDQTIPVQVIGDEVGLEEILRKIFAPLASLKLTVALFALGAFLVLAGTFAQVDMGIWDVMKTYFRSYVVWIPFSVFFPPSWFPGLTWISGGFWFPGGRTIGIALLANIVAAHVVRFKIQAVGARLWTGLLVILAGVVITSLVILYGNWKDGIQDKPMFDWKVLWYAILAGLLLLLIAASMGSFLVESTRLIERVLLALAATGLLALLVWLLMSGRSLDDSSLRILWNLIQGSIASLVLLVGCIMVFKRRAGIVLLHGGVALLMINELWIGSTAVEEQITIEENTVTSVARDIRHVELTVTNRAGEDADEVIAIPQSKIKPGAVISSEFLPFEIRVDYFFRNSSVTDLKPGEKPQVKLLNGESEMVEVDRGIGMAAKVIEKEQVGGADMSDDMDLASAYVTILPKEDANDEEEPKPLGTFLLSQHFSEPPTTMPDTGRLSEKITYDGKTYEIALHFKRSYKPYQIRLINVDKVDYVGTNTPRSFESEFEIIDTETGETLAANIKMNDPLRYKGETFYQSGYRRAGPNTEISTFQVVKNAGWMIPYVSCVIVGFGLLAQFSGTLFRFLNRLDQDLIGEARKVVSKIPAQEAEKTAAAKKADVVVAQVVAPAVKRSALTGILIRVIAVAAIGLMLLLPAVPRPTPDSEMRMDLVGKIPIAKEGRVMPLDSYARTTLEKLSERQEIKYIDKDYEKNKRQGKTAAEGDVIDWQKHSAIEWLMDVISRKEGINDVRIFRIYSPELLSILKLERRAGYRYSFDEVSAHREELEKAIADAEKIAKDKRRPYHQALEDLVGKYSIYNQLRMISLTSDFLREEQENELEEEDERLTDEELVFGFARFGSQQVNQMEEKDLPLFAPTMVNESSWETLSIASARDAVCQYARDNGIKTSQELGKRIWYDLVDTDEGLLERKLQSRLVPQLVEMIKANDPGISDEQVARQAALLYQRRQMIPIVAEMEASIRLEVDAQRESQIAEIVKLVGSDTIPAESNPATSSLVGILKDYQAGDVERFNEQTESYLAYVDTISPKDLNHAKMRWESFYNAFTPFYWSIVIYLIAFAITPFAWIAMVVSIGGDAPKFDRIAKHIVGIAFWLIVFGFAVHSFGIVERMLISGRPPVTNLYSSAVFIGWAGVLIGLVVELMFRMGLGNVLATAGGVIGLLIAANLAVGEDTFKVVVAVLDTQFWLATHVICVTLGYATTYMAGFVGVGYLLLGLFAPLFDKETRKKVSKIMYMIIYGIVCFALIFSFVGTVLGGLWADDSWGRFWGWDPKENGALIIVIWNALILHARWGGMVRERGVALLAVAGCIVTTWSWFGVNQLGIGLHSYGFTKGVLLALAIAACAFSSIILLGLLAPKSLRLNNY